MKSVKPISLDYNATTPLAPEVIRAMRPYLEQHFGNPSSAHTYGLVVQRAVTRARTQVAALLGCSPEEIIFTSGGTESNNYALIGAAFAGRPKGNHIITTRIEHPAVLEPCRWLATQGFRVTYLPVDAFGRVRVAELTRAITARTILISIMHANNEVGTIQPLAEIARITRRRGIIFHTDAAQSVGKIPAGVRKLGVDLLSIAGHKLYAPKGIGALYVRRGIVLKNLMYGAGQEQGRRPGTENILGIVGLGAACAIARRDLPRTMRRMRIMRDRLYQGLQRRLSGRVRLNGHPTARLPNTLSLSFPAWGGADRLIDRIKDSVAVSAGAACHSRGTTISPVLQAMNVPLDWARGTIRFSTGRMTTAAEIDRAIKIITHTVLKSILTRILI